MSRDFKSQVFDGKKEILDKRRKILYNILIT